MSTRSAPSLRRGLFAFALLGSFAVLAVQSCAESNHARDKVMPAAQSPVPPDTAVPDETLSAGDAGIETTDAECPTENVECGPGFLCCTPCCIAGRPPVCTRAVEGHCPLPDLSVNEGALAKGIYLETIDAGTCEMEERCLSGTGKRRVLRFDVRVPNSGMVDLTLGKPDAGGAFEYAACHAHYHFNGFAHYKLLDETGNAIIVGRKQAFCARDSARVGKDAGLYARYDCDTQGIQRGWEDIYDPTLPCQYLDVTDLAAGSYRLEVEVNPGRTITELRYDNNRTSVKVDLP